MSLVAVIAISTAFRGSSTFWVRTPIYYSDEYLYSALARSIARTGWPTVRGHFVAFPALLGPYLMAPAWAVGSVQLDYHLAQLLAAAWFSSAAIPLYLLARRIELGTGSALFVAAVGLIVPNGALTATLLTEPYAYPAFFWTVLAAVNALDRPSLRSQGLFLGLCGGLCLLRLEFVAFLPVYALAAFVLGGRRIRHTLREHWLALTTSAALLLAGSMSASQLLGSYSGVLTFRFPVAGIVEWAGINLFVLGLGAGWVVLPGAFVGLKSLLGDRLPARRAFALLTLALLTALVGEAAAFGVNQQQILERYTFYTAPLVLIAFCWAFEHLTLTRGYRTGAYAAAGLVLVVPLLPAMRDADDGQALTLVGLQHVFGAVQPSVLLWAPLLSILAVAIAQNTSRRLAFSMVTTVIAVVAVGASSGLAGLVSDPTVPRLGAPHGSALVTSGEGDRFGEMKSLLWNPAITRVVVVDGDGSPDGFAATTATFAPHVGGFSRRGRPVEGSFVVAPDGAYLRPDARTAGSFDRFRAPAAIVLGWSPSRHYLRVAGRLLIASGRRSLSLHVQVSSIGPRTIGVTCSGLRARSVPVRRPSTVVLVRVPPLTVTTCRFALVRGAPEIAGRQTFGARVAGAWLSEGR